MMIDKKTNPGGIILTIVLLACCLVLPHYFMQDIIFSTRFLISRISFWVLAGILFIYAAKVEKRPFLIWSEQKHTFIFYPVSIIGVLAATFIGGIVISILIKSLGLSTGSSMVQVIMGLSLTLRLLAVITAAVTEEFIFRGYLMSRLQQLFKSPVWPIVISSLIFGVAHMGFGTFINMAIPLFIGLVFAWHYYKYRNLTVLIVCHFLIDFFSIIMPHAQK